MSAHIYRYEFNADVPLEDVEASLVLAILGTESLHGETEVQLCTSHYFDHQLRSCVIDSEGEVGNDLNRLFAGFLRREFGPESFSVKRQADSPLAA